MRSDSDRNLSASLTRITRQVSRTFNLKVYMEEFMEIDKKEYGKYVKQVTPVHNTW